MNKVLYIFIIYFISCSPARRAERAEQTVLTTPTSFEKVGRKYINLHPCVADSVVRIVPGIPIIRVDTLLDTSIRKAPDTVYKTITKTITRVETKTDVKEIAVKDKQSENLLKEEIESLKASQSSNLVKIANLQNEVVLEKSKKNKWFWLFIIVSSTFGIYLFRKPIFSLITKIPIK